jgi:hypothetical protein
MLCSKTATNSYACAANAQSSPGYEPQLMWTVSRGKILGDPKTFNITVDVTNVKTETVTVRLTVHWRNVDKVCDRVLSETINLRGKPR